MLGITTIIPRIKKNQSRQSTTAGIKENKMDVVELVNKYGFPIVMAVGMGFIIKYVWEWSTKEVKPVLSEANGVLIALIDRIRMLDNDLIRLNQKVNTVLHLRGKTIEYERVEAEKEINQTLLKSHDKLNVKRRDDLDPDDVKTAAAGEG
jgi:hypothetical protein